MQLLYELMITELGLSLQPFKESYKRWDKLWLKSIWEKVDLFDIQIEVNNVTLDMPKNRDDWLMQLFICAGYSKADLL